SVWASPPTPAAASSSTSPRWSRSGRAMSPWNSPTPPICRPRSTPTRGWPRCCFSRPTKSAKCPTRIAAANTRASAASPCPRRDSLPNCAIRSTRSAMNVLITGGSGFIGSALIRYLIDDTGASVLNVDKLTYAANPESLAAVGGNPRYRFQRADICDRPAMDALLADFRPDAIMHLAAESHVDRSIHVPGDFILTNVLGTYTLLEAARQYWSTLPAQGQAAFRFHHISTDEVYGDLEGTDALFTEATPYAPSSPYSASKAGSDH